MGIEMLLNAKGENFDLFRKGKYIGTLKGSLNKKEKNITFRPNEVIFKGDKLVRKLLKEEFVVLDIDIISKHGQPFYKKIFYSTENFGHIDKGVGPTINIAENYAPINTAGGNIESNNTTIINETSSDMMELKKLIDKLAPTINQYKLNPEEKEDLKDGLDVVSEQIELDKPNVSRLRNACSNIKGFVMKASKGAASTTLVLSDWQKLIEKIQEIIKMLS